jgi:hypothetical protein
MVLADNADYQILLQRVASVKKLDPIVYIDITERAVRDEEKENIEPGDNSEDEVGEEQPKKKKKLVCCRFSHFRPFLSWFQDPATLPGNRAKIENLSALRKRWLCSARRLPSCIGSHCYVNPDTQEHLSLSHERLDCWASAMVIQLFMLLC